MKRILLLLCLVLLLLVIPSAWGARATRSPSPSGTVNMTQNITNEGDVTYNAPTLVEQDANASALTYTLLAAAGVPNAAYNIVKTDSSSNVVTVDGNGAETIGGALVYRLTFQGDFVVVQSDGSNWQVVGSSGSIVNVKWFGATGDGTTDDTAAIKSACDVAGGGGTLLIPRGTYLVTSQIDVHSDTTIRGYGALMYIDTAFSSGSGAVFVNFTGVYDYNDTSNLTGTEDITIEGITVTSEDNANQPNPVCAVAIFGGSGVTVQRVTIRDVTVYDTYGNCMDIRFANEVTIDTYKASGWLSNGGLSWGAGLVLKGVQGGSVSNFVIRDSDDPAWHAIVCNDWYNTASQDIVFSSGYISNVNTGDGITFEQNAVPQRDIRISDMEIEGLPGGQGFDLDGLGFMINNVRMKDVNIGIIGRPQVVTAKVSNLYVENGANLTYAMIHHLAPAGTEWEFNNITLIDGEYIGISIIGADRIAIHGAKLEDFLSSAMDLRGTREYFSLTDVEMIDPYNTAAPGGTAANLWSNVPCYIDGMTVRFTGANKPDYGLNTPSAGVGTYFGANSVEACDTARYLYNNTTDIDWGTMEIRGSILYGEDSVEPSGILPPFGTWVRNSNQDEGEPAGWVYIEHATWRSYGHPGDQLQLNGVNTGFDALLLGANGVAQSQFGLYYDAGTWLNSHLSLDEFQSDGTRYKRITIDTGNIGIRNPGPDRHLDVLDSTNPQLRLTHTDSSVYTDLQADAAGNLQIKPSGSAVKIKPGTKCDGLYIYETSEVQTTDATQTTLESITLLNNNTYIVEAFVIGVQSTGGNRASYHIAATVYRTGGGAATLQGAVTSLHSQESDANWDATFTVAGNNVLVRVTGVAATTIEWGCTVQYLNMSN